MIHNNRAKSSSLVRRNLMNKGCARPNTSNYVTRPIKSGFGNLNSDIFDIDSYTIRASHDLNQTQANPKQKKSTHDGESDRDGLVLTSSATKNGSYYNKVLNRYMPMSSEQMSEIQGNEGKPNDNKSKQTKKINTNDLRFETMKMNYQSTSSFNFSELYKPNEANRRRKLNKNSRVFTTSSVGRPYTSTFSSQDNRQNAGQMEPKLDGNFRLVTIDNPQFLERSLLNKSVTGTRHKKWNSKNFMKERLRIFEQGNKLKNSKKNSQFDYDEFKEKSASIKMKIINANSIEEIEKEKINVKKFDQKTSKSKKFKDMIQKYMNFLIERGGKR